MIIIVTKKLIIETGYRQTKTVSSNLASQMHCAHLCIMYWTLSHSSVMILICIQQTTIQSLNFLFNSVLENAQGVHTVPTSLLIQFIPQKWSVMGKGALS